MAPSSNSITLAHQVLDYLCPYLVEAGAYARGIQGRLAKHESKPGMSDPFGAALTDADLSVQTFIEVALLARFPRLAFFGEEYAQSPNMKYFPKEAALQVLLDPIDGTLFFQDGLDNFNIIVSLADRHEIIAAACYVPGRDKLFSAVLGAGTRVRTAAQVKSGAPGEILDISENPAVMVTYDQEKAASRLAGDFEICCIARQYRRGQACLAPNAILLKEASVLLGSQKAGLIDWGALAFLIKEAGGRATSWHGEPFPPISELPDLFLPQLLACSNETIHGKVVRLLNGCEPES